MLKKIINYLEFLKYKSQFITFNRNNFNKSKQNNNIILIEFNTNNLSIIAYSFFAI